MTQTTRGATAALGAAVAVLASFGVAGGATPAGGRIDATHQRVTWSGGPLHGSAPARRNATCNPEKLATPACDSFDLEVNLPRAAFGGKSPVLNLRLEPSGSNVIDLLACPPGACQNLQDAGNFINYTAGGDPTGTGTNLPPAPGPVEGKITAPAAGTWKIRASCEVCANATYTLTASVTVAPAPVNAAPNFTNLVMPGLAPGQIEGAAEPGIRIGKQGEIWIDGNAGPGDYWGSYDGGKTFKLRQPGAADILNTTGDTWMTVGPDGTLYADSLMIHLGGGNIVYVSRDKGETWTRQPAPDNLNPDNWSSLANVDSDRQWLTADPATPGHVWFTYHDLADGFIWVWESTDYAKTWLPIANITGQELVQRHEIDSFAGNVTGPIAVAPDGTLYFTISFSDLVDGLASPPTRQDFPLTKIFIARSTDGGRNWTLTIAHDGTGKEYVAHLLQPPIGIDQAGNLYLIYSSRPGPDGLPDPNHLGSPAPVAGTETTVFLKTSRDEGQTWSGPVAVSATTGSNVFPTLAAGGKPGYVDIVWLTSTAKDYNDTSATWRVVMAQSADAFSATPQFAMQQVSPDVMHVGDICQSGTLCLLTGGNRDLLDYIWVTTDDKGVAHVAYADDAGGQLKTVYARQTHGMTTLGTAIGAAPAAKPNPLVKPRPVVKGNRLPATGVGLGTPGLVLVALALAFRRVLRAA